MTDRFNVRVYGILKNEQDEILISDECRNGYAFTKFPGGGLEFGEGIEACLKRELKEELDVDASVGSLFYVNEFYQQSAFRNTDQLISFYYLVESWTPKQIEVIDHVVPLMEDGEFFRWVKIQDLSEDLFTFPIDKIVADKLRQKIR